MEKMDNEELISALADGQLQGDDFARAVALAATDPAGRRTWHAYHAVGEVLRSGQAAHGVTHPEVFLAKLQVRLESEARLPVPAAAPVAVVARAQTPAANDWLWKMVAGAASVAAVVAVSWNVLQPAPGAQPQLAAAPGAQAVAVRASAQAPQAAVQPASAEPQQQPAMIRDPRLDRLLAAHRQLGGANAWQSTSGFLRTATSEGPAR